MYVFSEILFVSGRGKCWGITECMWKENRNKYQNLWWCHYLIKRRTALEFHLKCKNFPVPTESDTCSVVLPDLSPKSHVNKSIFSQAEVRSHRYRKWSSSSFSVTRNHCTVINQLTKMKISWDTMRLWNIHYFNTQCYSPLSNTFCYPSLF